MLAAHDGAIDTVDIVEAGVAQHEDVAPLVLGEIVRLGVAVEGLELGLEVIEDLVRFFEGLLAAEHQLVGRVDAALDDPREGVPVVAARGDADEVRVAELEVRGHTFALLGFDGVDLLLDHLGVGTRAGREAKPFDGVEVPSGELVGIAAPSSPAGFIWVHLDVGEAHVARGVGVADRGVSPIGAGWVIAILPPDNVLAGDGYSQDDGEAV